MPSNLTPAQELGRFVAKDRQVKDALLAFEKNIITFEVFEQFVVEGFEFTIELRAALKETMIYLGVRKPEDYYE